MRHAERCAARVLHSLVSCTRCLRIRGSLAANDMKKLIVLLLAFVSGCVTSRNPNGYDCDLMVSITKRSRSVRANQPLYGTFAGYDEKEFKKYVLMMPFPEAHPNCSTFYLWDSSNHLGPRVKINIQRGSLAGVLSPELFSLIAIGQLKPTPGDAPLIHSISIQDSESKESK